jgi:hypothetical protein
VTRLECLTREIAAELVQGPAVAALVMDERERAGVSYETWHSYQRLKVELITTGMHAAVVLLAAAGSGTVDERELERLTDRLELAWVKLERLRSSAFEDELHDVAAGGDKA